MHIEVIIQADDWAVLAEDWNGLLAQSPADLPFLRYEFQRAWWEGRGGGEWPNSELHIVVGRDANGRLSGIAPLFRAADRDGTPTLMLIGSHEIADFLDVITPPDQHADFVAALIEHLASEGAPGWRRLDLYNLLDDSPTPAALHKAAETRPFDFKQTRLQPSPYIPVPTDFDAYLEMLEAKQAHEMRRKLRRAAEYPVPVNFEVITEGEAFDGALEDFFRLMSQEADKAAFLNPAMRVQMEAIARAAAEAGWAQFACLDVGDQRAAVYLNFDYGNRIWAYNAGFDPQFAELSPGWLLMAEMMKWCIANGRTAFDFMRGGEEYKYRFGGVDRFVERVTLSKRS